MKVISLYSDVDYFIFAIIAVTTVVIFLNWLGKKIKLQKNESVNLLHGDKVEIDLSNYMLNFKVIPVDTKSVSLSSKVVLFFLAATIIFVPLYELIIKLTPEVVYYGGTYILF